MNNEQLWRSPRFDPLLTALLAEQEPIYVVGGAVRDFLLGRDGRVTDLDLALSSPVLPVARQAADRLGWAYYPLDAERDVARIISPDGLVCDLAALRGDLAADLALRDFTVNALALELRQETPPRLVDRCGGVEDLRGRRLRAVSVESFASDPVRLLRAVRFAAQLDFALDEADAAQIAELAPRIAQASVERRRDELWKIFALARPGDALAELHRLGLLAHVLPEAAALERVAQSPPHQLDVFGHTVQVMNYAAALRDWLTGASDSLPDPEVENALAPWQEPLAAHFAEELSAGRSRADWLVWHALFHDAGKPAAFAEEMDESGARRIRFFGHEETSAALAGARVEALHFSRREAQVAVLVAAGHMRPHHLADSFPKGAISRRASYRFFRDTASGRDDRSGLDVLLLALADRQAPGKARGGDWQAYLTGVASLVEFAFTRTGANTQPLLDGRGLMRALDLSSGRMVGFLLESIAEAQAAGEIASPEEAVALAADLLRKKSA